MVSGGTRGWGDWEPFDGSPYVDWDDQLGGLSAFTCGAGLAGPPVAPDPSEGGAAGADAGGTRLEQLDRFYSGLMQEMLGALSATPYRMPPFPPDAAYCDDPRPLRAYFDKVRADGTLPEALRVAPLAPAFHMGPTDAIIGVIDLGIGLGQRRTRRRDTTSTRILAAWQQSAARGAGGQAYLPFGREMLADDINAAIGAHTHGDRFDEDTFNRFTGVEDYRRPLGQREAGLLAPHGPHILDCAAGYDPDHDYPAPDGQPGTAYDPVEQRRIIAVNLPARELVGHAAQYLEFFAIFGLLRIAILSDALWEANAPRWTTASNDPSAADGFDIVVNLSFGKQASARDGSDLLTRTLARINAVRQSHNLKPIYLSMPAGNENLDRGNARTTLGAGATQDRCRSAPAARASRQGVGPGSAP